MRTFIFSILLFASQAFAGNLQAIIIADGNGNGQLCDGNYHLMTDWFVLQPGWIGPGYASVSGKTVVASYVMISVTGTNPGADVNLLVYDGGVLTNYANDVHILQTTPSGAYQGQTWRPFPSGDGIYVASGTVNLAGVCWGGGRMNLYSVIYVR